MGRNLCHSGSRKDQVASLSSTWASQSMTTSVSFRVDAGWHFHPHATPPPQEGGKLRLPHCEKAALDQEVGACDSVRFSGREEDRGPRHVLGLDLAADQVVHLPDTWLFPGTDGRGDA